jgi:lipopolysaccharide export system permease protein
MNILSRYILKEFFRSFATALSGISIVYLCVDFLQKADDFIRLKATLSQIIRYFLYNLPSIITPSIPIAALIATLLSLGALSRHNEIIAMRAGGISLGRIVLPVLAGGLLISALGFINNELIMPTYVAKANYIRKVEIEKKQQIVMFKRNKLWLRGPDNSIANIAFVSPDRNVMFGLNIFKLNQDFTVRERIQADRLSWEDNAWRLQQSMVYVQTGDTVVARPADGEVYNIVESPADLGMIVKSSEEMSFAELWDYVRRIKTSGYNAMREEMALYGKISFPIASLLMVMIATPLSLQRVRSGGAGSGIAIAVFISFAYWGLLSIGTALGRSGALPPLTASWLANVLFSLYACVMMIRMHRNS